MARLFDQQARQGQSTNITVNQDVSDLGTRGFAGMACSLTTERSLTLFSGPGYTGEQCWIFCPPGQTRTVNTLYGFNYKARSLFWARPFGP